MTTTRTLDPAVHELLLDLRKRAPSRSFALEPEKVVRGLGDGSSRLRTTTTGLSSAERELVTAHRWTIASALQQAALDVWLRDTTTPIVAARTPPGADRSIAALVDLCRARPTSLADRDSVDIEVLCGERLSVEWASHATALAARFVDSPTAHLYVALSALAQYDWRVAARCAEPWLDSPNAAVRRCALETWGNALIGLRRLPDALGAYSSAVELALAEGSEDASAPAGNVLTLGVQLSDLEVVHGAAAVIDQAPIATTRRIVARYGAQLRRARASGMDLPRASAESIRRIADETGPMSRELLHALV